MVSMVVHFVGILLLVLVVGSLSSVHVEAAAPGPVSISVPPEAALGPVSISTPPGVAPGPATDWWSPPSPVPDWMSPAPSPSTVVPYLSNIAVEGVVYCRTCKGKGHRTVPNPSPLSGVVAKLKCYRPGHWGMRVTTMAYTTTDANGYFLLKARRMEFSDQGTCKVVLKLPKKCNKPLGSSGLLLYPMFDRIEKIGWSTYQLFNAGFSEYAPLRCHHRP